MFNSPAAPKFLHGSPRADKPEQKTAVIFDCDGVLVDTEFLKYQAWAKALAMQQISFSIDEYMPLIGLSSKKIMAGIINLKKLTLDADALIKEKNAIYDQLQLEGVPLIPDAINFLKELIAKKDEYHIKIGLASSAPRKQISENLKQIGVKETSFDSIVSGSDDLKHIDDPDGTNKPKPYIYHLIAEKLEVKPGGCIVFEDSEAGVIAGAKAGMSVIAVPNQFTNSHDFSSAKALSVFKNMTFEEMIKLAFSKKQELSL